MKGQNSSIRRELVTKQEVEQRQGLWKRQQGPRLDGTMANLSTASWRQKGSEVRTSFPKT